MPAGQVETGALVATDVRRVVGAAHPKGVIQVAASTRRTRDDGR